MKNELALYQLAGISDCLVSDISSIIIDLKLLHRPILLLFEDIKDYQASRGFSFNPISDWLLATFALSFESSIDEVDLIIGGEDKHQQKQLKSKIFEFEYSGSSTRIPDCLFDQEKWKKDTAVQVDTYTFTVDKK